MRNKRIGLILSLILVFFVGMVFSQSPIFQEVKKVALTVTPDGTGDYLIRKDKIVNGQTFRYVIGYLPRFGHIGVAKLRDSNGIVVLYNENDGTYTVGLIKDGKPVSVKPVPEELASEFAEEVLNAIQTGEEIQI
jgi:hypothetical protein